MSDIFVYSILNEEYIIGNMSNNYRNGFKSGVATPKKLIIPFSIDSKEIKAIGKNSFRNSLELEECVINAKIHTIYDGAFAGCQNLHKINIPSTVATMRGSALDGRIDRTSSSGPLKVYFEPKSQLKRIENAGISNFRIVRVYIYDKIYPTNSTYMFGGVWNLVIYSPYLYKFCGFQTTFAPFLFQTRGINKDPLIYLIYITSIILISR